VAPRCFGAASKTGRPIVVNESDSRATRFLKWGAVGIALAVFGFGIWLLVLVAEGVPVAAAFTRVGGTTNVETAVDASRFWLTRPQVVVETRAHARMPVMLGAAHCAMVNDAPLLFTSTNRNRRRRVNATTESWWGKAAKSHIITITNQLQVENCLNKNNVRLTPVRVTGLSVLQVPSQQRQLQGSQLNLPAQSALAPFVVFAAPIAPGQEPDVAVGLAVAEHLAKTGGGPVSLVVIPRYLEADPGLEDALREQPALVQGGIVLGQTPTVPDDTQALLRQVLTTVDRQSLGNQIQAALGSAGSLIAALLALLAAALAAPKIIAFGTSQIREIVTRIERTTVTPGTGEPSPEPSPKPTLYDRVQRAGRRLRRYIMARLGLRSAQGSPKGIEWLKDLTDNDLKQELIISLGSGWTVAGKFPEKNNYKTSNVEVWQINDARLGQEGPPIEPALYVRVPVADIELIRVNYPDPTQLS